MLARCTRQDAAERGGTPSPALPLSPTPVWPPRGACGLQRQDDTHGEGSGASPHSPLELQEAPAPGHQGENEECRIAMLFYLDSKVFNSVICQDREFRKKTSWLCVLMSMN